MIDFAKLPAEGLRLEGVMPRLELEAGDALREITWRMHVLPSGADVFLDVRGQAVWEGVCSRCLEPFDAPLGLESQFLGSKDPDLVVRGAHALGTQDLDVVFFPETLLDEEALVREQFQLQIPMNALCRDDCAGLCSRCGKNWNKGPCTCRPEQPSAGALAKALTGLKLQLNDPEPSGLRGTNPEP
jgi:uncharacterized protein